MRTEKVKIRQTSMLSKYKSQAFPASLEPFDDLQPAKLVIPGHSIVALLGSHQDKWGLTNRKIQFSTTTASYFFMFVWTQMPAMDNQEDCNNMDSEHVSMIPRWKSSMEVDEWL